MVEILGHVALACPPVGVRIIFHHHAHRLPVQSKAAEDIELGSCGNSIYLFRAFEYRRGRLPFLRKPGFAGGNTSMNRMGMMTVLQLIANSNQLWPSCFCSQGVDIFRNIQTQEKKNVQRKEKLHVKSSALPAFAAAIVARAERLATPEQPGARYWRACIRCHFYRSS
jgi:hypothetical protein